MPDHPRGLFPALLKHWRSRRGSSQLDLALAADVSSRHVSFLETGRSAPSAAMVLKLAAALDVPLRHVNEMLHAAGLEPAYPEPSPEHLPPEVRGALELMKAHHEPFPLVVVDRAYTVLDLNRGAGALFGRLLGKPADEGPMNLLRLVFDPNGARPVITNFEEVGRALLWRAHREVLDDPGGPLRSVLDAVLAMPTVDDRWRDVDLSVPASPALVVHLEAGPLALRFLTMMTRFQAPQSILLDEIRIETWFPADEATKAACDDLTRRGPDDNGGEGSASGGARWNRG